MTEVVGVKLGRGLKTKLSLVRQFYATRLQHVYGAAMVRFWKWRKDKEASAYQWSLPIWRSQLRFMVEDLRHFAEVDPDFDFLGLARDLVAARDKLRSDNPKLTGAIALLVAFLLFTTFEVKLPISVWGLTLTAEPGVAEIIILVVAILGVISISRAVSIYFLTDMAKAAISLSSPKEMANARLMAMLPDQPPPTALPALLPNLSWSFWALANHLAKAVLIWVVLLAAIGWSIWWRALIYGAVWQEPSIAEFWARASVLVSLVLDIGSLFYAALFFLPTKHTDHNRIWAYEALSAVSPSLAIWMSRDISTRPNALADALRQQIEEREPPDDVQRILTRASMPPSKR